MASRVKRVFSTPGVLGCALALGLGTAVAQTDSSQAGGSNPQTGTNSTAGTAGATGVASVGDKKFIAKAAEGSNFEIKAAQLALQKTQIEGVKHFAQLMIKDHNQMNDDLIPVAQQAGVTPPTGISPKDQAAYSKLEGLNGTEFDQAYIRDMVKDHTTDLKEFQMEAAHGRLPAEKAVANQGSGVITVHLQLAKKLAQENHVTLSGM